MSKVLIETKGGPLTDDDFEADAPAPGSSDQRYSPEFLKAFDDLAKEIAAERDSNA